MRFGRVCVMSMVLIIGIAVVAAIALLLLGGLAVAAVIAAIIASKKR